jgi:hypothetical protein
VEPQLHTANCVIYTAFRLAPLRHEVNFARPYSHSGLNSQLNKKASIIFNLKISNHLMLDQKFRYILDAAKSITVHSSVPPTRAPSNRRTPLLRLVDFGQVCHTLLAATLIPQIRLALATACVLSATSRDWELLSGRSSLPPVSS